MDAIYRFMDKLSGRHKEQASVIAYHHAIEQLGGAVTLVFYDMTALYFEAEEEDDLRKIGFSKDRKFQKPQIMLGPLVEQSSLPIGYDIFEGNTLLPVLKGIQAAYSLGKPLVVADAGLLSSNNLKLLVEGGWQHIIGSQIKNESAGIKAAILKKRKTLRTAVA